VDEGCSLDETLSDDFTGYKVSFEMSNECNNIGSNIVLLENKKQSVPQNVESSSITNKDVLCGRDKVSFSHCGNKRFRHIIEMYRERYQTAPVKDDKTKIIMEIVALIKNSGGRFLKRRINETKDEEIGIDRMSVQTEEDFSSWYVIDEQCAHEKVSHALRSARDPNRKEKRKKRQSQQRSETEHHSEHFKNLLRFQGMIFQDLLKRYNAE